MRVKWAAIALSAALSINAAEICLVRAFPASESPKVWLHFTVDGQEWKILRTATIPDGDGDNAMAYSDRTIRVRKDVPESELGETVMHEVMHALSFRDGAFHDQDWNNSDDRDDTCDGHCGIYHMTPKLLDLIANNPELMAFFREHRKR